jgi:site-specific recombinase XerD
MSSLTTFRNFCSTSASVGGEPARGTAKKLSGESVYLEIAALRAFYRFCENERLLPANLAENLALPRRWKACPGP